MALGDVCHPAIPSGILAESQHAGHSVLLSKACHPPCRALRESDGPTTNPCESQVEWCMALGFAWGWVGPLGRVVLGFAWTNCSSVHAEGSCQAVLHSAQSRES